jgi:4-carboxymuconolactone decarboxylase
MDKYQKGLEVVKEHLSPHQVKAIEEISPYLKDLVIEYGMGEIYARKGLDQKSRKIATIASLITSGNTPQIKWHISGGLDSGVITKKEIEEVIIQMVLYIGFPQTLNAMKVAREVFEEKGLADRD